MIQNKTPFESFVFPFQWPNGHWKAVVVLKANFKIQENNKATLSEEKPQIVVSDRYYNDCQNNSIEFASDLVPLKHNIDIVINGSAYAPMNESSREVIVGLQFSNIQKSLRVLGEREWKNGLLKPSLSRPVPFERKEIRYEDSFGGIDETRKRRFVENPSGCGYRAWRSELDPLDQRVPGIFYYSDDCKRIDRSTKAAGFGFLGAESPSRTRFLGTYNEEWQKSQCPNLALDFDFHYFNSAPLDQQLPKQNLQGQWFEINNMSTSAEKLRFQISDDFPVLVGEESAFETPSLDTICIMPDKKEYYAVWRTQLPLEGPDLSSLHPVFVEHHSL